LLHIGREGNDCPSIRVEGGGPCEDEVVADDDTSWARVLVEHVRRELVRDLGANRVDVWLGKDGLVQRDVEELASVTVRSLALLLDQQDVREIVADLVREGAFTPPAPLAPHDW
jgi:hypothetical protein